jgi:hypothetical protein
MILAEMLILARAAVNPADFPSPWAWKERNLPSTDG